MIGARFTCIDCGTLSPEVSDDGASTLVSVEFGWRIRREIDGRGRKVMEARCPICWAKRRSAST
jgi:hypothetical protein